MAKEELLWHTTATQRLLEARKKNGRLGSRKAKTGCLTCKVRRIKCDETKPECERCRKTGRKCDGYSPDSQLSTYQSNTLVGICQPQSAAISSQDRRTLDFFLSSAAPRLAGIFDRDFWCGFVLQLAQTEPIVTDCILAISTLYEHPQFLASFYSNPSGTLRTHSSNGGRDLDAYHQSALIHYNKAIRAFNERISEGIELIRDNIYAALELHKRGAELLRQYEQNVDLERGSGLLTMIKHMFGRIGTLAPAFAHRRLISVPYDHMAPQDSNGFASIGHARNALFAFMTDSHAFIEDAHAWKESLLHRTEEDSDPDEFGLPGSVGTMYGVVFRMVTKTPDNVIRKPTGDVTKLIAFTRSKYPSPVPSGGSQQYEELQDLWQQQCTLLERLEDWLDALQITLQKNPQTTPETASYLLMYYHSTMIWISTRLHLVEGVFDEFTSHFKDLVDHAAIYLQAKVEGPATFTFEIGATPALFLAAAKCRVPSIRRRALCLMSKAPRKECMHGSKSTAEFARRLVEIEEMGLGLPVLEIGDDTLLAPVDDTILPPEHQRIRGPELLKNVSTGLYEVKVERYSEKDGHFRFESAYDTM